MTRVEVVANLLPPAGLPPAALAPVSLAHCHFALFRNRPHQGSLDCCRGFKSLCRNGDFASLLMAVERGEDAVAVAGILRDEISRYGSLADGIPGFRLHPVIRAVWEEASTE